MFQFSSFIILALANVKQESFIGTLWKSLVKRPIKFYMVHETNYLLRM